MHQHGCIYICMQTIPNPKSVGGVAIQLIQCVVILHIKLKGIAIAATLKQIFVLQPHPDPSPGGLVY